MSAPDSGVLDQIRQHAALVTQRPDDPAVRERFASLLQTCSDRAGLEELAERAALTPEVAVPVCERLLELSPSDAGLLLRLGMIHYTAGDDEAAARCLTRARELEGETVRVLRLAATLAQDNEEKKRLYTRIMQLDPSDREIWHYLIALNR